MSSRRCRRVGSFLELGAELDEAAGDAAGDRAGRDLERGRRSRGSSRRGRRTGRGSPGSAAAAAASPARTSSAASSSSKDRRRPRLAPSGPQARSRPGAVAVEREPARELGQPRLDGVVVAQLREVLVGPREGLLVDVLGVGRGEPVDRVAIA